ncbi:hypothetical protein [Streptomyces sp. 6N223]|uniref:hypothetical protein n=1 Tax=Streptomyces sp. 6N223 TaxID=3457412 RepID=UPI003FD13E93
MRKWQRAGAAREARAVQDQRARRDALHLLADGLCAVCRERDDAARRWLGSFTNESNADPGVRARVRAAGGFCPAHTRRLLEDTAATWLLPRVHAEALAGCRALLAAGGGEAALGPCPACEAGDAAEERALEGVLRGLGEPEVRDSVRGGAVCLPHTAALAGRSAPQDGAALVEAASARLAGETGTGTAWLAGPDADVPVRARHQQGLEALLAAEESAQRVAVAERWEADVRRACCPLCLAGHRAARRLLRWAATTTGAGHPTREETALCPRHLHDLDSVGGPKVPALLADNAEAWRDRLARFSRQAATGRAGWRAAAERLPAEGRCRACEEERTASGRQAALLVAALSDPVRVRAYERAHGICLRHALAWDGPLPEPVAGVLAARLAWLEWEVTEALRKQDWHTRHEAKGAEMAVGRRAPTLLDGRVYAGLPAPLGSRGGHGGGVDEDVDAAMDEDVHDAMDAIDGDMDGDTDDSSDGDGEETARRPRWSSARST